MFVQPVNIASGDAETKIAHSAFKPTVWSPASSFWGRLANYEADKPLTATDNPSLVRTPLVIAMWKQLADAYGYPKHKLGYKQLGELAQHGWAAVGKPQFGAFKFVHTNPDFSTSGLSEVAAQYYAAAGKSEGLTVADVTNPKVRDEVAKIENSIVHYGDTTLFVEDELAKGGLGYASAAAIEEATLIDFNRKSHGDKLVAIYPSGGTFYSDSPLMTLNAPWVTPAQKAAARQFTAFLGKDVTAQKAGRFGFRPADPAVKPAGLVTAANGADPAEPTRVLTLPEPEVLAKIKAEWRAHRKPANVMVVFDNSGSMGAEDKLTQAKQGLKAFFAEAAPQDRIGLTKFSTDVTPLVPIAPMRHQPRQARAGDRRAVPRGGHAPARCDRRRRPGRAGPSRQERDQRRRRAHRRAGHRVGALGRPGGPDPLGPGREGVGPDPRVHDRLRLRRQHRRARALRTGDRRQAIHRGHVGHREGLPVDLVVLLA